MDGRMKERRKRKKKDEREFKRKCLLIT